MVLVCKSPGRGFFGGRRGVLIDCVKVVLIDFGNAWTEGFRILIGLEK